MTRSAKCDDIPTAELVATKPVVMRMVITDKQGVVAQLSDYWISRGGGLGNPNEIRGLALEQGEVTDPFDSCFRSETRSCLVLPWDTIRKVEVVASQLPGGRSSDVWATITLTNGEVLERKELAFGHIVGMTAEDGQYAIYQADIQSISFECCTTSQQLKRNALCCGRSHKNDDNY